MNRRLERVRARARVILRVRGYRSVVIFFVSSNARGARGVEAWTRARVEAMTITTSADAMKFRTARCAHWRREGRESRERGATRVDARERERWTDDTCR